MPHACALSPHTHARLFGGKSHDSHLEVKICRQSVSSKAALIPINAKLFKYAEESIVAAVLHDY